MSASATSGDFTSKTTRLTSQILKLLCRETGTVRDCKFDSGGVAGGRFWAAEQAQKSRRPQLSARSGADLF